MEKINVKLGWSEKNFSACTENSELLGGIVIATGKTYAKIKETIESALKFHIEGCVEDGKTLPEWLVTGKYEIEYTLTTSALLHSLEGILTHSAISHATGINQKLIGHYASGFRNPRPRKRNQLVEGINRIGRELAAVI
jgi:hypothetical protein